MIREFDKVRIKEKNITRTVVDITNIKGKDVYFLEDKEKTYDESGDWQYKIYQCLEDELELIERDQ